MIQRKQTVFLLIAAILNVICLFNPLGGVRLEGMGILPVLYNIGIRSATGTFDFLAVPLFFLLATASILSVVAIFQFKKRPVQSKLCLLNCWLYVLWYVYGAFVIGHSMLPLGQFKADMGISLPLISLILTFMARRGIVADEKLVKSMDRIR